MDDVLGVLLALLIPVVCVLGTELWLANREVADLQDKLHKLPDERDASLLEQNAEEREKIIIDLRKRLIEANDRADRNAAIAQGLSEELAALKAYDPEEIEERLKRIREIRAAEEQDEIKARIAQISLAALCNPFCVPPAYTGHTWGFGTDPASACMSESDRWRMEQNTITNEKQNVWGRRA